MSLFQTIFHYVYPVNPHSNTQYPLFYCHFTTYALLFVCVDVHCVSFFGDLYHFTVCCFNPWMYLYTPIVQGMCVLVCVHIVDTLACLAPSF